jgi:hypothetical protein
MHEYQDILQRRGTANLQKSTRSLHRVRIAQKMLGAQTKLTLHISVNNQPKQVHSQRHTQFKQLRSLQMGNTYVFGTRRSTIAIAGVSTKLGGRKPSE